MNKRNEIESSINSLLSLSLTDRLYVIERILKNNSQSPLVDAQQVESEIKNMIEHCQPFLENGVPKPSQAYTSKF